MPRDLLPPDGLLPLRGLLQSYDLAEQYDAVSDAALAEHLETLWCGLSLTAPESVVLSQIIDRLRRTGAGPLPSPNDPPRNA